MGSLLHESHALETVFPVAAGVWRGKVPTSHVALEVALETKPNLLLLTEEAPAMENDYVSRDHMWIMWSLLMVAFRNSLILLRLCWNIGKLSEVPTTSGSFMLGASRVILTAATVSFFQVDDHRNNLREIVSNIADAGSWVRFLSLKSDFQVDKIQQIMLMIHHLSSTSTGLFLMQVISARADDGKNFGLALTSISLWPITGWSPKEKPMH